MENRPGMLLIVIILHFVLLSFSFPCQKLNCIFHLAQVLLLAFNENRAHSAEKISFSLLITLSRLCRAAILDNALLFYQVGTCRENFAVMKLTAMKTYILRIWYMLLPIIRLNTAEDFPWTKNNPGSFYYGTFPAGTFEQQLIVAFLML